MELVDTMMHQLPPILQLDVSSPGEEMTSLLQGPGLEEYYQVRITQDHLDRARDFLVLLKRRKLAHAYREKYDIKYLSHATILRHAALIGLEQPTGTAALNLSTATARHLLRKSVVGLAIETGLARLETGFLNVSAMEPDE